MEHHTPQRGGRSDVRPLVSFLTTAYKTEHLVGETIDSVLAQTRGDWELVVVDNGNSAEMAAVVGAYLDDDRIRLVRQENAGYAGGVMAAAAVARGRFVCVLDSDDHVLPDFCRRVGEEIAARPDVAAVCVDAHRFAEGDQDLPVDYLRSVGVDRPDPTAPLRFRDVLAGTVPYYSAAIRADAWDAVGGYDPGMEGVDESVVIWLRLTRDHDVRMIPDVLARYRIRSDSLSRDAAKVEGFEDALERSFASARPLADPADDAILQTTLDRMAALREIRRARWALVEGDTASARRAAWRSLRRRRSVRAALLVVGLTLAPGLLRRVRPAKNAVQDRLTAVVDSRRSRRDRTRRSHILVLVENLSVPMDRRVWQESRALTEAGHRVTVICPMGTTTDTAAEETIDGVRILRYPLTAATGGPAGYLREYPVALLHTVRLAARVAMRSRVDVVHGCNPPDFFFLVGLLLRLRGARFVFDQHDLVPELFASRFESGGPLALVLDRATRLLERLTYASATGVIATNESYRRTAIDRGGCAPDDVTVVRSAPDLSRFVARTPDDSLRRGRRHLAAYLGVMGPQDGVDHALRALAHLRHDLGREDLHTIVMGSGDEFDSLVALARELRIDDVVEFTGRVPDEFVQRCLSTADVCLSPDPLNPLNDVSTMNKVVEYMAMGRPLVSYDLREARVSAGDAALYVPGNDVEAFGRGIATLLDDPERREKMGILGRERVERELSWENSTRSLLAFYERVLSRG
ncbi:glycosyltransferase [Williamsia deligens]|uniref:Glycosyltransferase n=1 Tax=Williamsia deligens TaxID=321325 RepID=A0ABW3G3C4_9NOCA|nr:glycosyltransferase [Williamsia deligens]MCP2194183.1 Glycosyltransferase involved in cell wall bisynthesis [Williamsia deligens]